MLRLFLTITVLVLANPYLSAEDATRRAIIPDDASVIAPYSPAIEYKGGLLFVSGHIPYIDGAIPNYAVDGENDIQDQTKIVMETIKTVLNKAGYTFNDALKVTVFLADINDFRAFNEVYGSYWPDNTKPPAREAIQVAALPGSKPNAPVLVEVSLIAGK